MKFILAFLLTLPVFGQAIVTNWNVLTIPAAPSLPAAGGTWTDPTFGTTVMRVTSAATEGGNNCYHHYSYWQVINKASTRFLGECTSRQIKVWNLNPTTFTLGSVCTVGTYLGDHRGAVDMSWSMKTGNERIIYTASFDKKIMKFTFDNDTDCSGTWTVLKDFTSDMTYVTASQMSFSEDDRVFVASDRDGGGADWSCMIYYASGTYSGTVWKVTPGWEIDECQVDKTGRYVMAKPAVNANGVNLYDTSTQTLVRNLSRLTPVFSPAHSDSGRGIVIANNGGEATGVGLSRSFSTPLVYKTTVPATAAYNADDISLRANNEQWYLATGTNVAVGLQAEPLLGELAFIKTDGSQLVRRVGFHYASATEPKGLVSYDGRFVLWRSDWMGSGRIDIFIAKVTAPPTSAPNLRIKGRKK
jgi:hypothetical protein